MSGISTGTRGVPQRGGGSGAVERMSVSLLRAAPFVLMPSALLLCFTLLLSQTSTNTVKTSGLGASRTAITPNQLKPAACAGVNLTHIVTGSGVFAVTSSNNLVLASAGTDTITLLAGNNCVDAGAGTNICIASPLITGNVYINCSVEL